MEEHITNETVENGSAAIAIDMGASISLPLEESGEESGASKSDTLISNDYLSKLFLCVLVWVIIILGFIGIIDPYGVSPLQINLSGINTYKPKRIDIDRLIKPYEVWRYQPKTIFLGTSRIQQSIDPSVLDGTDLAPAYNAAVPAATITENAAFLEEYIKSDPNLKQVFFELFIYAFISNLPEVQPKGITAYIADAVSFHFSSSAFTDSLKTWEYNHTSTERPAFIHPRGYWVRPENWDISMNFVPQNYAAYVLGAEKQVRPMQFRDQPFAVLQHLQDLCDKKGIKLTFIITPNYPWDDYRLLSTGYVNFVREFYQRVSTLHTVYSFAQNTGPTIEPVSGKMKYWSEPLHFSRGMGAMIQSSLANPKDPKMPKNFMLRITPSSIDTAVKIRFDNLQLWRKQNPSYPKIFEMTKRLVFHGSPSGLLDIQKQTLTIEGKTYFIQSGIGTVETARKANDSLTISGWTVDTRLKSSVDTIVATAGNKVIAQTLPGVGRYDIEHGFGINTRPAGFTLKMPKASGSIRVFAIKNNIAGQLSSEVSAINGQLIAPMKGELKEKNLKINGINYPVKSSKEMIGAIESAGSISSGYKISGWALDKSANLPVQLLVATKGDKIIAMTKPIFDRPDVNTKIKPMGFFMDIPAIKQIKVFAIMKNGTAIVLASNMAKKRQITKNK